MKFPSAAGLHIAALMLAPIAASAFSMPVRETPSANPIGRVARLINPSLVKAEERLTWLENRLRGLAVYSPKPQNEYLGWRAVRTADDAPPSLTLDLGDIYPLDDIFLVPAKVLMGETQTFFPLRFQIEVALAEDFSDARVIYETHPKVQEDQQGYPVRITARDIDARYVRLRVLLAHHRGIQSLAALSEMVVVSGGQPVSFGAHVTANGSLDAASLWHPDFVVDGRSPLGIWEGGRWTNSRGQALQVEPNDPRTEWWIDLGRPAPIDRVVLFPLKMRELGDVYALPRTLSVILSDQPDGTDPVALWTHKGGETYTPLNFTTRRRAARYITIRAETAVNAGTHHYQPLSEIEVWSHGRNLAAESTIEVRQAGSVAAGDPFLTDGYANGLRVFPVGTWLQQLSERRQIESELARLVPLRNSMATESELNAAWGASIAIGLTLLIPVAFVERRRLVSRKQIESLRKRIASDLHDDIGSNLGSISLIARSAKKDLKRLHGPDELLGDLDEVEVIARESSLAMRDIVWLLEKRQDTIGDFVQRMRDCAQRLLRDVDYEIICRSNRTAARMNLDAKRHLFLFYKEALHNILKHSRANHVTIHLRDHRDRLVMEIHDNGIGLPVDDHARPTAVRKLADRAAVLEARLEVNSRQDRGTHLRLEVKRSNLTTPKPVE